jgi:hypothetical protein
MDTRVIMSFDEIVQLGKKQGYPVTDKQEFHMFLSYQHEVRNVIFHKQRKDVLFLRSSLNIVTTSAVLSVGIRNGI